MSNLVGDAYYLLCSQCHVPFGNAAGLAIDGVCCICQTKDPSKEPPPPVYLDFLSNFRPTYTSFVLCANSRPYRIRTQYHEGKNVLLLHIEYEPSPHYPNVVKSQTTETFYPADDPERQADFLTALADEFSKYCEAVGAMCLGRVRHQKEGIQTGLLH
jgi:hypothetical protein